MWSKWFIFHFQVWLPAATWLTKPEINRLDRIISDHHFLLSNIYFPTNSIYTDWWFGTFFIFPYIWKNHPNWLIFFRGVESTNQRRGPWQATIGQPKGAMVLKLMRKGTAQAPGESQDENLGIECKWGKFSTKSWANGNGKKWTSPFNLN